MLVLSMNENPDMLSLSWDSSASNFMPCPAPSIISISDALTATPIVGPDLLPCKIPWKGMG